MRERRARGAGGWLAPADRLKLSAEMRGLLERDPKLTIGRLVELTGAPDALAQLVRARWHAARKARAE